MWPDRERLEYLPHLGGLGGQALAINDDGVIVGHSETSDRASKACVWTAQNSATSDPLSAAIASLEPSTHEAISLDGSRSTTQEGGQAHFRPACWPSTGSPIALTDLGGGWGEAVAIDETGIMSTIIHNGAEAEAELWDGRTRTILGQLAPNVRAFYPIALTSDGATIGTAIFHDHSREIAAVTRQADGAPWVTHPTAENSQRSTPGLPRGSRDTPPVQRALDLATDRTVFVDLPHYRHHHHQPMMISVRGWIVGSASADNCNHPLLWVPLP